MLGIRVGPQLPGGTQIVVAESRVGVRETRKFLEDLLWRVVVHRVAHTRTQIADDLKRNGGFIPGIKPGRETSNFIDNILTRVTFPGSLFLATVAILPAFAGIAGVSREFSQFYGGTSLLIMVGVILDTLQQIESYLLMRHYEGMMKSGKLRGRTQNAVVA